MSTHSSPAGTYLTDSKGMMLYLWKADTGSSSKCAGPCANVWAPLTTSGTPQASGGAQQSMLGTTSRSDGATQVTYANHPLYYYTEDEKAGQMEGQGSNEFGNTWYIVGPNGSAITGSSKGSGSNGGSSGGASPSKSSYNWG